MSAPDSHDVTELLVAWSDGDEQALDRLAPLVQAELHRLARRYMSRERGDHLLQTSALINEAYLRLIDWKSARWQNRAHFFGVAAQMMRRILVDFARRRPRAAEGGARHVPLEDALVIAEERQSDLVALDEALHALAELDGRKARVVELRFFGGLSVEETAEVLKLSTITVIREWNKAKAYIGDISTKKVRELLARPPEQIRSVGVSRDGRLLYYTLLSTESDIWLLNLE